MGVVSSSQKINLNISKYMQDLGSCHTNSFAIISVERYGQVLLLELQQFPC